MFTTRLDGVHEMEDDPAIVEVRVEIVDMLTHSKTVDPVPEHLLLSCLRISRIMLCLCGSPINATPLLSRGLVLLGTGMPAPQ